MVSTLGHLILHIQPSPWYVNSSMCLICYILIYINLKESLKMMQFQYTQHRYFTSKTCLVSDMSPCSTPTHGLTCLRVQHWHMVTFNFLQFFTGSNMSMSFPVSMFVLVCYRLQYPNFCYNVLFPWVTSNKYEVNNIQLVALFNYGILNHQVIVAIISIICLLILSSAGGFIGIWVALTIYMSLRAFAGFLR